MMGKRGVKPGTPWSAARRAAADAAKAERAADLEVQREVEEEIARLDREAEPKPKRKKKRGGFRPRKPPPWPVFEEGTRTLDFYSASERRDERASGKPLEQLAEEFGVSVRVIEDVESRVLFGDAR